MINMANIVTCKTKDGETVQFVDEVIGSGSMKDVFFSPDKSYVVAFIINRRMSRPGNVLI